MSEDEKILLALSFSPVDFVRVMWGIKPERNNKKFIKGKHMTWQQHDILLAVENAIRGRGRRKISVSSGNGVGKSSCASWILLWYLFCFKDSQIACTAPSSDQLFDVLWKECNKWIGMMPPEIAAKYDWSMSHIRMLENPYVWFARAKTGRKESPEALAGLHADHVFLLADESSGIPDEIFSIAEGSLTEKNTLVLLLSNPTRLTGYFYDTFGKDRARWKNLKFSSLDSPLKTSDDFAASYEAKYGVDSDEYRIHVLGEFPNAEGNKAGYICMLGEDDLVMVPDIGKFVNPVLGVDPAGEGKNPAAWVIRDKFRAKVVAREFISTPKSMALKTATIMEHYGIPPNRVAVDDFGPGSKLLQELSEAGVGRVLGVNVGEKAADSARFINKRAEYYMRVQSWIRQGGQLIRHDDWRELLNIKYRRELNGRIKIMGKREMLLTEGIESPNCADALMLTMSIENRPGLSSVESRRRSPEEIASAVNIYGKK